MFLGVFGDILGLYKEDHEIVIHSLLDFPNFSPPHHFDFPSLFALEIGVNVRIPASRVLMNSLYIRLDFLGAGEMAQ